MRIGLLLQFHLLTSVKGVPRRMHRMHVHPKEISDKTFFWSQLAQPLF